jgi:hypothetical protein
MKSITKLSAIVLAAVACSSWPAMAQNSTPESTNTAPAPPAPRRSATQFWGTISSIDATAMTLTLKGRNADTQVKVTSATKIFKDHQPGTFSDAAEGLRVTGSGKKGDDGVWTATTLHIRTRPAPKSPAPPGPSSEQK